MPIMVPPGEGVTVTTPVGQVTQPAPQLGGQQPQQQQNPRMQGNPSPFRQVHGPDLVIMPHHQEDKPQAPQQGQGQLPGSSQPSQQFSHRQQFLIQLSRYTRLSPPIRLHMPAANAAFDPTTSPLPPNIVANPTEELSVRRHWNSIMPDGVTFDHLHDLTGTPSNHPLTLSTNYLSNGQVEIRTRIPENSPTHFPWKEASHAFRRDDKGLPYIYTDYIESQENAPKGSNLALSRHSQQVQTAKQLGFAYLALHAASPWAGNNDLVGHIVWPKLGYNQSLALKDKDNVRKMYSAVDVATRLKASTAFKPLPKTVLHLLSMPGGQQWWDRHGTNLFNAKFDLTDGSDSLKALRAYQRSKGFPETL